MKDQFTVTHCEHISALPFDQVVSNFEGAVGQGDGVSFRAAVAASRSAEDFESRMQSIEGPSGFMMFLEADHGAWMHLINLPARAKLYVLGNPLIARTMIQHSTEVGLNVPVRVLIYEDPHNVCRLAYDLPSSLMSRLNNSRVTEAAQHLDAKLAALAERATGVTA